MNFSIRQLIEFLSLLLAATAPFALDIDSRKLQQPFRGASDIVFRSGFEAINDDQYVTLGNVQLVAGANMPATPSIFVSDGVLANDPPFQSGAPLSVIGASTPNRGGAVAINADGTFVYTPPPGVRGEEMFTYEVTDGIEFATAQVTILITEMVWFVDSDGPPGDGRSNSPFVSLEPLDGAGGDGDLDEPGDFIFLFESGTAYGGGIELEDDQQLVGQGVDLRVSGELLVPASGRPTVTNDNGSGITLADNSQLRGFNVNATSGDGIAGDGIGGNIAFESVAIGNAGDNGFDIRNTGGLFIFSDTTISDPTGVGIKIEGLESTGIIDFTGAITSVNGGGLVDVTTTAVGSNIVFRRASPLTSTASNLGISGFAIDGDLTFEGPTTIQDHSFSSVFMTSGEGNWRFDDLTITNQTSLNGGIDIFGQTGIVSFDNLNITTDGTIAEDGVTGLLLGGNSDVRVTGSSSIDSTGGPAIIIINVDSIDMTFTNVSSTNSRYVGFGGQDGITLLEVLSGSLTVTGQTTITNPDSQGLDLELVGADLTFADIDIANSGSNGIISGVVFANSGTINIAGGSISNTGRLGSSAGGHGVRIRDSTLNLSGVVFDQIAEAILNAGNSVFSGSGNSATNFGTFCEDAGGNTGNLDFGALGTCPN